MKSILFLIITFFCSLSWADWKYGIDQNNNECGLQVLGPAKNVRSQRGLPLYDIDMSLGGKKYLGVLAEIEDNMPLPFDTLLKESDKNVYTRVIGAPITIAGIGLRTVKGELLINKYNEIIGVEAIITGSIFGKKQFKCLL
ncbi:MAG: hypothetical protein AB7I27_18100 [Bacteriovoracaceae bacterium]